MIEVVEALQAGVVRGGSWFATALAIALFGCADPPEPVTHRPAPAGEPAQATVAAADEQVQWRAWHADSFESARRQDRLVLVLMSAPWAGAGLLEQPETALRFLIEQRYVPVRVHPLHRPDIARRYAPAGWPALAVTLPDGRLVATATDIPQTNIRKYLSSLANHYRDRPEALEKRAMARQPEGAAPGGARRGPAVTPAALFEAIAAAHDAGHGGFGSGAKFPEAEVLRFLLDYHARHRDENALRMASRGLDILCAPPMWDAGRGGVLLYSFTPDWKSPIMEKDAVDQAGLLQALVSARPSSGERYADSVAALVAYIRAELFDPEKGFFHGRQVRPDDRPSPASWWTDPTVYVDRNALLIQACLRAAPVAGPESGAADMALAAATYLLERCVQPDGMVYHCVTEEGPLAPGLLDDQILAARALWAAYQYSEREEFAAASRRVLQWAEAHLRLPDDGAFADGLADPAVSGWGAVTTFRDAAVPAGNAAAAALYLDMGDLDRAAALLRGRVFEGAAPRRAHASHGRALMRLQARSESP